MLKLKQDLSEEHLKIIWNTVLICCFRQYCNWTLDILHFLFFSPTVLEHIGQGQRTLQ